MLLQFRFSTARDRCLMVLGTTCACIQGTMVPLMMIVFGSMSDLLVQNEYVKETLDYIVANITNSPYCRNQTCAPPEQTTPDVTVSPEVCNVTTEWMLANMDTVLYVILQTCIRYVL